MKTFLSHKDKIESTEHLANKAPEYAETNVKHFVVAWEKSVKRRITRSRSTQEHADTKIHVLDTTAPKVTEISFHLPDSQRCSSYL